jgi:TonB family protein
MKIIIAAALLSGCASTSVPGLSSSSSPTGIPRILAHPATTVIETPNRTDPAEAAPWFPERMSDLVLPSARPLNGWLRDTGHDTLRASLRLCVAPDGSTASVDLEDSSGVPAFDDAALADVKAWRYQPFPAPEHLRTCKPITLVYSP